MAFSQKDLQCLCRSMVDLGLLFVESSSLLNDDAFHWLGKSGNRQV